MRYDQCMCYLELRDGGEKLSGAGFFKVECWEKRCVILVQVSGLDKKLDGVYEVKLFGDGSGKDLGEIEIREGRGRLELRELGGDDGPEDHLKIAEMEGLRIRLNGRLEILGKLERKAGSQETYARTPMETHDALDDRTEMRRVSSEPMKLHNALDDRTEMRRISSESMKSHNSLHDRPDERKAQGELTVAQNASNESGADRQDMNGAVTEAERQVADGEAAKYRAVDDQMAERQVADGETVEPRIEGDRGVEQVGGKNLTPATTAMAIKAGKWEQLDAIYPHIVPFGDRRRYLQISPGDFVILKEKSYRKVNNSFLLHGYFTYKHLILCKMLKKGENVYYVGVPGRFFDREKEVALLFGFESFEGGIEPAKEGDFGYYMMRVEL